MVYIIHLTVLAYLCLSSMVPEVTSRPHQVAGRVINYDLKNMKSVAKANIYRRQYQNITSRQATPPPGQEGINPSQQPTNPLVPDTSNSQAGPVPPIQNNPAMAVPSVPVTGNPVNQVSESPIAPGTIDPKTGMPVNQPQGSPTAPGVPVSQVPESPTAPGTIDPKTGMPVNQVSESPTAPGTIDPKTGMPVNQPQGSPTAPGVPVSQVPESPTAPGTIDPKTGMPVNQVSESPTAPGTIDPKTGMPVNQTPKLPAASPPTGLVTGKPLPQTPPSEASPSPVTGDQGNNPPRVPPTDSLPAGVDNGASTPANNTNGQGDSDISISESEFQKAVQAAGGSPTAEQYKYFAEGVRKYPFSNKREVAMFLANVLHESGGLQYKAEIKCQGNGGCPGEYSHVPGEPTYYGRGYMQLTWKENYRAASLALLNNDELVKNPGLVATDEKLAWDVAFHYWFTRVHTSEGVINGRFGDSISKINGALECGGGNTAAVAKRQEYFTKCLSAFGVNEQPDFSGC